MKKVLQWLKEINIMSVPIKLAIVTILIFSGFFVQPIMYVAFFFCCLFIFTEISINSFYMILYLLPFMHVFSFKNSYGFTFWNLLVVVYVFVVFIKFLIDIINKKYKFDWKLLIPFGVFALYLLIPFRPKFSLMAVAEAYVWLALFYFLIFYRKEINLPTWLYSLIGGLFVSGTIGLLVTKISYLRNLIVIFYTYNRMRYSALLLNPNMLYEITLTANALLFILVYNCKINKYFSLLTIPLVMLGISTLSKTYLICLLLLLVFFAVSVVIIFNVVKLKKSLTFIACVLIAGVILFPHSKELICRINDSQIENAPITNVETPSESSPSDNTSSDIVVDDDTNSEIVDDDIVEPGDTGFFTGRVELWKDYLRDLLSDKKSLIIGKGLGGAYGIGSSNSHNAYVQVIYELGIFGTLLFGACVLYLLIYLKFSIKKCWIKLTYFPLVLMALYYFTENHFMSQMGNMMLILSSVSFLVKGEDKDESNS